MKNIVHFLTDLIGWFILIIFIILIIIITEIVIIFNKIFKNDHFIRAFISLFGGVLFFCIILLFSSKIILSIIIGLVVTIFCFLVLCFLEGCNPKNKKEVYL